MREHRNVEWGLQFMTSTRQAPGSPRTYLSLQQKPCKVLVAVNAFREVHLDSREWPAHAVWGMGTRDEGQLLCSIYPPKPRRSKRARVTPSGTCPRAVHQLMSPRS